MGILGKWKNKEGESMIMDSVVRRVYIDKRIYEYAVKIGNEVDTEVGFYMVGYIVGDAAYVLDLIEFPYKEKSYAYVESNWLFIGKISTLVPLGLSIIGTMHKHPDGIGSMFSGVDEENFLGWARVRNDHVHIIFSRGGKDVSAYSIIGGEVKKVPIEFIEPGEVKRLKLIYISASFQLPMLVRDEESDLRIRELLEKQFFERILKRISGFKLEPFGENQFNLIVKPAVLLATPRSENVLYEVLISDDIRYIKDVKKLARDLLGLKEFDRLTANGSNVGENDPVEKYQNRILRFEVSHELEIRRAIEGQLKEFEARLSKIEETVSEIAERVSNLELLFSQTQSSRDDNDNKIEELTVRLEDLEETIERLNDLIAKLAENKKRKEEVKGFENEK